MHTGILLIAHAPLASALRACALHVFPDAADSIVALDVLANDDPESSGLAARSLLKRLGASQVLVLADVFGATPCNVAQKIVDGVQSKLVAGVNLPMLLRTMNYRHEALDLLVARALSGGTQSIMQVAVTAPQNQHRITHDLQHRDYQQ